MVRFGRYLFIIFIIVISIFALKALWGPQFYTSHDGQSHLARLYQLDKVLKDGQFPPRWAGQFAGERGYPVFVFAYPLPYWTGEFFHILGLNLAESIKLVFGIFYIFSGVTMYWLVNAIFKNKWAGFMAAVLYLFAPYRFVKIFVTASLGESAAFAFIPLVLLSIYRFSLFGLVLSLAGLILTHIISLIMFLPLIVSFAFWSLKKMKKLLLGSLLAFGLAAFYLVPAIWETRYTRYQEVLSKNYFQQFVEPVKLLYSKWGYGVPKIGQDELSLQIGISQWLGVALGSCLIIYFLIKKSNRKKIFLAIIFFLNFILSIFLMLSVSKTVWNLLPPLQNVDTPWRFLSLSVFTTAFLGSWFIHNFKYKKLMIFISLLLLFLAFYSNRNHLRINAPVNYPDKYFETYYWVGSGWDEYRPVWIKDSYHKPPKKLVEISKGNCEVDNQIKKSNLITFNLSCQEDSEILTHVAYYPGWRLFIDEMDLTQKMTANLEKSSGLILFDVSQGNHQVALKFGETYLRLVADSITLLSVFIMFFTITKNQFFYSLNNIFKIARRHVGIKRQ